MERLKAVLYGLFTGRSKYRKAVMALAITVVFITSYMLILPALTLDKTEAEKQGGIDVPEITAVSGENGEETAASEGSTGEASDTAGKKTVAAGETSGTAANDGKADEAAKTESGKETANAAGEGKDAAPAADPLAYIDENYTITVEDDRSVLPGGTEIQVEEIEEKADSKEYQKYYDDALEAVQKEDGSENVSGFEFARFYDISLLSDGEEIKPENAVSVRIEYDKELRKALGVKDEKNLHIVHFAENEETGKVEAEVLDTKDAKVEVTTDSKDRLQEASFEADSFSVYAVVYTVDFSYSVDGKTFEYSIDGGSKIALSQLAEALGLVGEGEGTFASASEFIEQVADVKFSDESLVKVTKAAKDTKIAAAYPENDGEDELWAVESSDESGLKSAFGSSGSGSAVVKKGDWILESLKPFTSSESLTIVMKNGDVVTIDVSDAQYGSGNIEIGNDGIVSLTDLANISATCQSNTTDVEWDAQIDFLLRYVFTEAGVSAVTSYVRENHKSPTIVYDFSSIFDETALNSVAGASLYLSTGSKTVGRLVISEDGKATMTFTDLGWLMDRNSLRGTFNLDLYVDENEAKDKTSDTVTFPGTSTGTDVTYKSSVSNATKSLGWPNSVENEDGSVTIYYNASIDANTALDSLIFQDSITSGDAIIDAGSVKVNGNAVSGLSDGKSISFNIGDVASIKNSDGKIPSGKYTVSYTATIPADKVAAIAQGDSTTVVNSSKWRVNGTTDVDADPVTYTWTKPVTPVPVTKTADKTNIDMTSGTSETVTYTLTFGDSTTPLADFRIADYITDVFTDYSAINVTWGSGSTTLTAESQATDSNYSTGSVTLFDYTFGSDVTGCGPVTVTYSAKTIDAKTAKKNNIFDTVYATNTAKELRTNNSQTSTTTIKYPEKPDIVVSKTASIPDEYKNPDGTLKDGAKITYTITIGDGNTDVSNLAISDTMSHLQSVDLSTADIKIGSGSSQRLTEYITSVGGWYKTDWYQGGGSEGLFGFTVPAGENDTPVYGPIVITYTTTVMSKDAANDNGIWNSQNVENTISAGGKTSTAGGTKDYGVQPTFPVEKTASATDADGNAVTSPISPGSTINYTVTFGGTSIDGTKWPLDGATVRDEMNDIQKLTGNVTVTLSSALKRTITWPDGTVWEAGQTSFAMPTGSSKYADDGVVWTDFFDDGQYLVNGEWPRVFSLKLPDGRIEEAGAYFEDGTVMTVNYSTTVITQEEALANSIIGQQNAYNRATANNQSSQTTVPVKFDDEVKHEPTIQKDFDHWDFDGHNVYWTITIAADTEKGSSYPLENITVQEEAKDSGVWIKNSNQNLYYTKIQADDFDMINAVVKTASGVVLQPGEDYTVFKGEVDASGNTVQNPCFFFTKIEEPVTITLSYNVGENFIIDGFEAGNKATVKYDEWGSKSDYAEQKYSTNEINITKSAGTFDKTKRVIPWTVIINPAQKILDPDLDKVIFNDTMPEGLKLINYRSYANGGNVDTENPSFQVAYSGTVSGTNREYGETSYSPGRLTNGSRVTNYDEVIYATVTNEAITNANIAAIGVYNEKDAVYMSGQSYTVTYYTYIDDNEWDRITSSLTGSKTYENTATVEMGDQDDLHATGSKTVTSDSFIWKKDTTKENSKGVVIDANNNQNTNVLSYQIDVNPYAMKLVSEDNAKLTLTDKISTNMDLDTSGDGVTVEYEDAEGNFVNIKDVKSDSEYYALFQAIKVSYNDDTRYVTITNIPDEIHFRMTYNTVVRAQGTDTFENTAVLTGGGSHSASTKEEHTIQKSGGNIAGSTANITLRKIDENDISTKVAGATFEIYECTLSNPDNWKYTVKEPITSMGSDGEITTTWTETKHFDYNRIEAATPNQWTGYEGNQDTEQLKADFTITGTKLIGDTTSDQDGIVRIPGTLKEETLYYWVETSTADGYTAELNTPHYFVVYQIYDDDGNLLSNQTQVVLTSGSDQNEVDSNGNSLVEWQVRQWRGWALDDATQYANGLTVASLAAENTWTVNNQESEYTSISATKEWAGDYDNFYETRPEEGIQLKLIQISSDGTESQYGPLIPINVDDKGEHPTYEWPTYVWQQLPKSANNANGEVVTYTYRVEELPVNGYTTEVTANGEAQPESGIESGAVTVTNTLIPTKTNISVKKEFDQDSDVYPDQILVKLIEITTDKITGDVSRAEKFTYPLNADNGWAHTWKYLPTKDEEGNMLTYTVVEDTASAGDGVSYTVSYSDNGDGITGNTADDPLVITNTENGVEITKTFAGDAARLMADNETAEAMRSQISFMVTDGQDSHSVGFTVNDMTKNEDGSYSYKLTSTKYAWVKKGATLYVQESNGAFRNTELVKVSYSINGGSPTEVTDEMAKVTTSEGVTVSGGIDTVDFTNEYEEETVSLTVDKTWLDADGQNTGWPEGIDSITFNLTADEGSGAVPTGDTKVMTSADTSVTFTDLPKYVLNSDTEIVYNVTESVTGYDSSITSRNTDSNGNVTMSVTNQKASPRLYVQKKWVDQEGNETDDFVPPSLTIDLYRNDPLVPNFAEQPINTITLTEANGWKGYFETDSEGNRLTEGTTYYIKERGASGWTLVSYSDENGQAFKDLETITVTNKRDETDEKTSIRVQKNWTVNGEAADTNDWDPVNVQLVRYKAEKPATTVTVHVYCWGDASNENKLVFLKDVDANKTDEGKISIAYATPNYNGSVEWRKFTSISNISQKWQAMSGDAIATKSPVSVDIDGDVNEIYLVAGSYNLQGKSSLSTVLQDIKDNNASTAPTEVSSYEYDKVLETIPLNADNSWQYEFKNLPTEGAELGTKYLYKYDVMEVIPENAEYTATVTHTGGESITVTDGSEGSGEGSASTSQAEVGGTVAITNNKTVETTDFEFTKIWQNNGTATDWKEQITVTLNAYTNQNIKDPVLAGTQYTLSPTSHDGWEVQQSSDGKSTTFKITGLTRKDSSGNDLIYYVTETAVEGYKTTYAISSGRTVINDGDRATNGQQIINNQEGGYELPHTGGPGTTLFYLIGGLLLIASGILLIHKRKKLNN